MPHGLVREHGNGDFHFLTISCHQRLPYFQDATTRALFEDALERTRKRYCLTVFAYVVMPEHVHLLISEPETGTLSDAIKMLKLSVTKRSTKRPFWTVRYYDFNIFSEDKRIEKLQYIHWNPVARGLVTSPEKWEWSSFRQWFTGAQGRVEVESQWLASQRERAFQKPASKTPDTRHAS